MSGESTVEVLGGALATMTAIGEVAGGLGMQAQALESPERRDVCSRESRAENEPPLATILVADDSPDIVLMLALFLEANNYRVFRAGDGAEAVRLAATQRPDLILLDVMMPVMDGLTACRRLKADPDLGVIPVILITARHEADDVVRGLDAGADDYVIKPINFRVLAARVRSALRVRKAQDTIAKVNRELEAELAHRKRVEVELAQAHKLEAIGRLAAGIAHEINTPIQYVGDNIRFLRDAFQSLEGLLAVAESLPAEIRKGISPAAVLARIEREADVADVAYLSQEIPSAVRQSLEGVEQIAGIVRAMKEFSHPGSEEKQLTAVNHLIENTLTVARNQWKHVAQLAVDFDPAIPPVSCVSAALRQVILNLVINAAEAIAEVVGSGLEGKGTITVRTRRHGDWIEIQVADTGRGIPAEIQPRLFEPFFTTKEVGKGTGQGLAMAHTTIVEKHGGTIHFQSEVGRGTTFSVRLPIAN